MAIPLRNRIVEKVNAHGTLTDAELSKMLARDGVESTQATLEKALLDLEILGLISVSVLAKGTRRIEAVKSEEADEEDSGAARERDYEASFPNAEP